MSLLRTIADRGWHVSLTSVKDHSGPPDEAGPRVYCFTANKDLDGVVVVRGRDERLPRALDKLAAEIGKVEKRGTKNA